ncbi:CLOCK-interacting pacemaker isoform X2 [Sinocyclocheilus grahami]|uniref:CLOCK-interacting pacemaker-like n=2 Tax=Sinocyclocheilus grahami TaxID=75366 RepID=A0A672RJR8_SINGR|nr:PREDICTED: CLOCK-interacting pacemaker-like isoform X2 [Sinocyclocheilus grahami]XP_016096892.1 PREDICTED: CLOCK-interacting pacemaker-like isoform X2 [Sinocyclocheilus grahami]
MPKEPRGDAQGCVGERERTSRPASKNAKDKSNNAALLASRARAHTEQKKNGCDSRFSEKDSGYSDTGSDSLQTDADDQQSSVNEPQVRRGLGRADQGPLHGSHILVSETPELTPIFIIKNVVLKQPGQSGQDHILPSALSWDGGATSSQASTHVLLLHQPGINQSAPLHILKPQPHRSESKGVKKSKNTYLPILNSYPRIAPHPSKKTPEKPSASRGSNTEEHSLSKRVCTEEKRDEVSTTMRVAKQHLQKQPENNLLLHSQSLSQLLSAGHEMLSGSHQHQNPCRPSSPSSSLNVSSPSISSTQTLSPPSFNDLIQPRKGPHKHCPEPNNDSGKESNNLKGTARHRRFLNTLEILSQLGLLDITLRTQDLLRQNAATERDIAQLRQHAHLLFQAAQAGADAPAAWEKLQHVMAESGHYPSLKCLPTDSSNGGSQSKVEVEVATSTKPDTPVVYGYGLNGTEEVAPPSPLLAPMPDAEYQSTGQYDSISDSTTTSEQIRAHRRTMSPPDDPIMPPDSSTHGNLL